MYLYCTMYYIHLMDVDEFNGSWVVIYYDVPSRLTLWEIHDMWTNYMYWNIHTRVHAYMLIYIHIIPIPTILACRCSVYIKLYRYTIFIVIYAHVTCLWENLTYFSFIYTTIGDVTCLPAKFNHIISFAMIFCLVIDTEHIVSHK